MSFEGEMIPECEVSLGMSPTWNSFMTSCSTGTHRDIMFHMVTMDKEPHSDDDKPEGAHEVPLHTCFMTPEIQASTQVMRSVVQQLTGAHSSMAVETHDPDLDEDINGPRAAHLNFPICTSDCCCFFT